MSKIWKVSNCIVNTINYMLLYIVCITRKNLVKDWRDFNLHRMDQPKWSCILFLYNLCLVVSIVFDKYFL